MFTTKKLIGVASAAFIVSVLLTSTSFARGHRMSYGAKRNSRMKGLMQMQKGSMAKGQLPKGPMVVRPIIAAQQRLYKGAKKNSVLQEYDVNKGLKGVDPKATQAIKGRYDWMMSTLRGGATPVFALIPMQESSKVQISSTASGGINDFTVKGLPKGGKLKAIVLLPTSAHGGLNPNQLAKDQPHTVWVNQTGNSSSPAAGKGNVVGGINSNGKLVYSAVVDMELKPGKNHVFFDPYPGRTASVAGFDKGRHGIIDVQ